MIERIWPALLVAAFILTPFSVGFVLGWLLREMRIAQPSPSGISAHVLETRVDTYAGISRGNSALRQHVSSAVPRGWTEREPDMGEPFDPRPPHAPRGTAA